jgi:hypothetical protein
MSNLFMVLSEPVHVQGGEFAVVSGTAAGIDIMRFPTRLDALDYHVMVDGCLRMGVGLPFQYVIVETEADYASFRQKFDKEYERLSAAPQPIGSQIAESISSLKHLVAHILRARR